MSTRIAIASSQGPYDVVIDRGGLSRAASHIGPASRARRALVVADEAIAASHAQAVVHSLQSDSWTVGITTLQAEEPRKRMEAVESIWQEALHLGLDRHSAIISVGGGLVGDVAGFAAASFMRGIDFIQVPTTLLAMVDASIGGKTGINVPLPRLDVLGKNLAGAFWSPKIVLVDPNTLATLPRRELVSGLAECVKHAIIGDSKLGELLQASAPALISGTLDAIVPIIEQAINVKRLVVQADEREAGQRMLLNLGHTFAHAIEPLSSLDLTHGEAVSIGIHAASVCSERLGLASAARVEAIVELLSVAGLPIRVPTAIAIPPLLDAMRYDKKTAGGRLRLVLPTEDSAVVRDDIATADIEAAWHAVIPSTVH
jgi:3-dehydroquinate synthase